MQVNQAQRMIPPLRSASTLSVGEIVYAVGYSVSYVIPVTTPFGRGASGGGQFDALASCWEF